MEIKDVSVFKGIHVEQKCFMIGTGPSLTYDMLDQLIPHFTFAMNNISMAYPHTEWRPTYYINVANSTRSYPHWKTCAKESLKQAKHSFFWTKNARIPLDMNDMDFSLLSCHGYPAWSWKPDMWVSRWGTSMFTALQLAVYMGFDPIYLIGCDLGYVAGFNRETLQDSSHFVSDYLGDGKKKWTANRLNILAIDELRTYTTHDLTRLAASEIGVRIQTCSPKLTDIYPYISFEDALNE